MEWSASCETRSIDGGAQGGFGIGGPFGAITVGDFSLDDAGSERALADIIGGIDPAREVAKGEYLVARAADLAEQFARNKAADVHATPWDLVVIDEAHRLCNVYKPSNVIANTLKGALAERNKLDTSINPRLTIAWVQET